MQAGTKQPRLGRAKEGGYAQRYFPSLREQDQQSDKTRFQLRSFATLYQQCGIIFGTPTLCHHHFAAPPSSLPPTSGRATSPRPPGSNHPSAASMQATRCNHARHGASVFLTPMTGPTHSWPRAHSRAGPPYAPWRPLAPLRVLVRNLPYVCDLFDG
jgi:hypothetical protein